MKTLNLVLSSAMRMATPLLFSSLACLISQHSGIFNLTMEGTMLLGAFFGYYFAVLTGSIWLGLLIAVAIGLATGLLHGFIVIRFGVHQMVFGLFMSILYSGVTAFCARLVHGTAQDVTIEHMIGNVGSGVLTRIPVIGALIFDQNFITWLGIILFAAYALFLKRTPYGLALRAVGEHPYAAQSGGIDVFKYRYAAMILAGGLSAIGGAFMTLSQVGRFAEDMTGGRGWIALSAITLGRWSPVGTFLSCLLFGGALALTNLVQVLNLGLPSQFAMMIPYVLTIITLFAIRGKKAHGPAALMKPFFRN